MAYHRWTSVPRSPLFGRLLHSLRLASWLDAHRIATAEGIERRDEHRATRRALLAGSLGALGCATTAPLPGARAAAAGRGGRVVIVGAGLAGLTAAARLARHGIRAQVFDAQRRVGGRAFTLRGHFPCKAELGGELIDTRHTAIRALVGELGLTLVDRERGLDAAIERERYVMLGQSWTEAQVVEMFRPVAALVRRDRALLGGREVSHAHHSPAAEALDALSTGAWLDRNGVRGPLRALLDVAFTSELGRDLDGQSALSFLYAIGGDPDRFALYGDSDERYVVAEGSDAIPRALAARLGDALMPGHALVALRPREGGGVRCVFDREGSTAEVDADRVILALPFNQLRRCELAIELPPGKRRAIAELPYGTHTKVFITTAGRPWREARSSGTTFHDGGVYHESWESLRAADGEVALLTAFSGGRLGVSLGESNPEAQGRRFAEALDLVFPGSADAFTGRAARMHWPAAPFHEGSYACYGPGDWCRLGGEEGGAAGPVHFAGEHTSRRAPGFMEGAVESGERAAAEVIAAAR
jgi:monoamine oxidase